MTLYLPTLRWICPITISWITKGKTKDKGDTLIKEDQQIKETCTKLSTKLHFHTLTGVIPVQPELGFRSWITI